MNKINKTSDKHDAIIIGSGIGGLTCGALLAKNGLDTLILEQHFKPGGYVTSYKRNNFIFDVVHVISGLKKGLPLERIFSYIVIGKKVEFIKIHFRINSFGKISISPIKITFLSESFIQTMPSRYALVRETDSQGIYK